MFLAVFRPLSLQLRLVREIFGADTCEPQLLSSIERSHAVAAAIDLSDAEADIRFELSSDRPDYARQSNHRLAVAAGERQLHGPTAATVLARHWDGIHADRHDAARLRPDVRRHSRRIGNDRTRFRRLPS